MENNAKHNALNLEHVVRCFNDNNKTQHTVKDFETMLDFFGWRCAYTGLPFDNTEVKTSFTCDHIVPRKVWRDIGGAPKHVPSRMCDIVPCRMGINSSHGNKLMEPWFRDQEFFSEERLKRIFMWQNFRGNIFSYWRTEKGVSTKNEIKSINGHTVCFIDGVEVERVQGNFFKPVKQD